MLSALTKRIVLAAEPRDRPYELRDARVRGLILRVQPSGHKALDRDLGARQASYLGVGRTSDT